jgi:hypothetical protein
MTIQFFSQLNDPNNWPVEQTKAFSDIGLVCSSKEEAQATSRAFSAMIGFILGQGVDVHIRQPITITAQYDHEHMKEMFYVRFRAALLPSDQMTGQQIVHPRPEVKIGVNRINVSATPVWKEVK